MLGLPFRVPEPWTPGARRCRRTERAVEPLQNIVVVAGDGPLDILGKPLPLPGGPPELELLLLPGHPHFRGRCPACTAQLQASV